ncbi:hypothetical protein J3459_015834 [Metarhizium acridum]|uniref:uncharacterized protein n=1 Tax=Metarhizium acridum TaxID=92637 RepID=UPI001C6B4C85|nr:hypothetical protein J3458_015481 [Metarhizium acridum]KAG8412617.1 hypothetical protein J3459_015834 [Metarhizium acridum]
MAVCHGPSGYTGPSISLLQHVPPSFGQPYDHMSSVTSISQKRPPVRIIPAHGLVTGSQLHSSHMPSLKQMAAPGWNSASAQRPAVFALNQGRNFITCIKMAGTDVLWVAS